MAKTASVSRTIKASADTVWAMVSDVTRMGEWSPETTSCSWIRGATGPVVGAAFRGRNKNGFRRWSTVCKVIESQPGSKFVFDVFAGPIRVATWGYHIVADDAETCTVTETWDGYTGAFMAKVGHLFSGVPDRTPHNTESMRQTLDNLARAAEAA